MAKVASLFAKPSGKLANLVFATWKGIGYVRLFVIPGNPNTPAQQVVRAKFAAAVSIGKSVLGSVLRVFVDPFVSQVSGFAFFVGDTMRNWSAGIDFTLIKLTYGTLETVALTSAVYAGSNVTFTWSTTILGNGQATDKACCVVIDVINHVAFFNGSAARSAGTVNVAVGTGRSEAFMHGFLFFADSSTAPTVVSDTSYSAVTV
jgi:hypothetical protein